MNKKLQDKTWAVLPKEFKEEVKREFQSVNNEDMLPHGSFLKGCYSTMVLLFGEHNLTSGAEVEELKPTEPVFVIDSIAWDKSTSEPYRISGARINKDGQTEYLVGNVWAKPGELEPYTEPVEQDFKMVNNPDRRLTIAAIAMRGMLARVDDTPQVIAETAFRYADALIAESEKGGENHD